jgi:hypothetical protein
MVSEEVPPMRIRAMLAAAPLVAAGLVLSFSSVASAAPPILLSVGQVARHPTATWSLPPAASLVRIEVAISPDVGSDGAFFSENVKASDFLSDDAQTTWTDTDQIDGGTYFVHVGALDLACVSCGTEWSAPLELVVPPPVHHVRVRVAKGGSLKSTAGGGLACRSSGGTCTIEVSEGTRVRLRAVPARWHSVGAWSTGACKKGHSLCTITVIQATTVRVSFEARLNPSQRGSLNRAANDLASSANRFERADHSCLPLLGGLRPIDPGARRAVSEYGACLSPSFLTDFALPVARYAQVLLRVQRGIDPGECASALADARQALLKLLKSFRDALGDARDGNPLAFSFTSIDSDGTATKAAGKRIKPACT